MESQPLVNPDSVPGTSFIENDDACIAARSSNTKTIYKVHQPYNMTVMLPTGELQVLRGYGVVTNDKTLNGYGVNIFEKYLRHNLPHTEYNKTMTCTSNYDSKEFFDVYENLEQDIEVGATEEVRTSNLINHENESDGEFNLDEFDISSPDTISEADQGRSSDSSNTYSSSSSESDDSCNRNSDNLYSTDSDSSEGYYAQIIHPDSITKLHVDNESFSDSSDLQYGKTSCSPFTESGMGNEMYSDSNTADSNNISEFMNCAETLEREPVYERNTAQANYSGHTKHKMIPNCQLNFKRDKMVGKVPIYYKDPKGYRRLIFVDKRKITQDIVTLKGKVRSQQCWGHPSKASTFFTINKFNKTLVRVSKNKTKGNKLPEAENIRERGSKVDSPLNNLQSPVHYISDDVINISSDESIDNPEGDNNILNERNKVTFQIRGLSPYRSRFQRPTCKRRVLKSPNTLNLPTIVLSSETSSDDSEEENLPNLNTNSHNPGPAFKKFLSLMKKQTKRLLKRAPKRGRGRPPKRRVFDECFLE